MCSGQMWYLTPRVNEVHTSSHKIFDLFFLSFFRVLPVTACWSVFFFFLTFIMTDVFIHFFVKMLHSDIGRI